MSFDKNQLQINSEIIIDETASSITLPNISDIIKTSNKREARAAMFTEYCNYSTIHGMKYLGERNRFRIEKIFWIVTFIISISFCIQFIKFIWINWSTIPIIISFADKSTPIWKIPLPTFTICPDIKTLKKKFNFSEYEFSYRQDNSIYENWTLEEKNNMDINLQICEYEYRNRDFNFTDKIFKGNFIHELINISPKPDEIFVSVGLNKVNGPYELYYDHILTEHGLCFSFNLLPLKNIYRKDIISPDLLFPVIDEVRNTNWTAENGFTDRHSIFPFRTCSSYVDYAFESYLFGNRKDVDLICSEGDKGFKFAISTPGDIPQLAKSYTIPFNYEVLIDIKPELITSSDSILYFPPKIRNCFYENERYLKYFNFYSEANCELECLANYTLKKCGCVRFFMPRTKETPICGAGSAKCYQKAKSDLLAMDLDIGSHSINHSDCNCLPSCTSLTYSIGVTQAPWAQSVTANGEIFTKIELYFKDIRFWSFVRTKLYGFSEFAADAGGLMGLFMGISVLSIVEIFYFCTLRLYNNIKFRMEYYNQ